MAKLTNQFQRTRIITSSPDKHYLLDSEIRNNIFQRCSVHQEKFWASLRAMKQVSENVWQTLLQLLCFDRGGLLDEEQSVPAPLKVSSATIRRLWARFGSQSGKGPIPNNGCLSRPDVPLYILHQEGCEVFFHVSNKTPSGETAPFLPPRMYFGLVSANQQSHSGKLLVQEPFG